MKSPEVGCIRTYCVMATFQSRNTTPLMVKKLQNIIWEGILLICSASLLRKVSRFGPPLGGGGRGLP
jgi:hypothetical protein